MRYLALLLITFVSLLAAEGPVVNQSAGPPPTAWTTLYFYDGSSNLEYVCYADPDQPTVTFGEVAVTFARSDTTLTDITDSGNTSTATTAAAHYLPVGATVVVSGATVDADLNGTYTVVTVPSNVTFTFTTADVSDAAYTESTLQAVAHSGTAAGLLTIVDSSTTGTATTSAAHGLQVGNQVVVSGATEVTWKRSDSTLTSIVVSTNVGTVTTSTAHNLVVGNPFVVSGATVDTDLNGDYVVVTIPSATTFTITTVSVSDATYNEATLQGIGQDSDLAGTYVIQTVGSTTTFTITTASVTDGSYTMNSLDTTPLQFTTTAPRTTEAIWAIGRYQYSGTNLSHSQSADGNWAEDNVCDDRASLTYK